VNDMSSLERRRQTRIKFDESRAKIKKTSELDIWSFLFINQLLTVKDEEIRGDIMEFGIYSGSSFIGVMHFMYQNGMFNSGRRLFGFDSFLGLPKEEDGVEKKPKWKEGNYKCRRETGVDLSINRYKNLFPNLPLDQIIIVEGWFEDTLNDDLKKRYNLETVALAHIDCDLYISTNQVLTFLKPLIKPNTLLCFDDWIFDENMGECKAFLEFSKNNPKLKFVEKKYGVTQNEIKIVKV